MAEGQITFEQARDLVSARFLEQFNADVPGLLDIVSDDELPTIFWDNVDPKSKPPQDGPWFRFSVRHIDGSQSSLGEVGSRRFNRIGLVTVQIFIPAGARGLTQADKLGKMAVDAFEGKDVSGIWFRNVRLIEVGPSGPWFQYNVLANFTYDQTK